MTAETERTLPEGKPVRTRVRREQKRALETKEAILEAALIEFSDKGFDGASTRNISITAEVNHRLIGHHFGTKEELWKATAKYVFGAYTKKLRERYVNLNDVDEPVMLRLMLREFILFSAKVPHLFRFMVQANIGERARLDWLIENHIRPGMPFELTVLKKAQEVGLIRKGDLLHWRYIFIGAATSIFTLAGEYQSNAKEDPFDDAVLSKHVDMVLSMFLLQDSQSAPTEGSLALAG